MFELEEEYFKSLYSQFCNEIYDKEWVQFTFEHYEDVMYLIGDYINKAGKILNESKFYSFTVMQDLIRDEFGQSPIELTEFINQNITDKNNPLYKFAIWLHERKII